MYAIRSYYVQVLENAARHDLPPHLVYAMIREESRFDIEAVSRVGALGLMQLMPETAARYGVKNPLDPADNLLGGARYLKDLLRQSYNFV